MNYFKVLENANATNAELAVSYRGIKAIKAGLKKAHAEAYRALVRAQQQSMTGAPSTKLKNAKVKVADFDLKSEACDDALTVIKGRMVDQAPAEIQAEMDAINQIFEALQATEKKAFQRFLRVIAKAAMINEAINGEDMIYMPSAGNTKVNKYPGVDWRPSDLKPEDRVFYEQACDQCRVAGDSIALRKNRLMRQRGKLEKILTSQSFEKYVDSLLAA